MACLPFALSIRHRWFVQCWPLIGLACVSAAHSAALSDQPVSARCLPVLDVTCPEPTQPQAIFIQPTVDAMLSGVHQRNVANTTSVGGSTYEWVTQISPGLKVNARGANSLVQGGIKLDTYYHSKQTQPDQALPSGSLIGRTQSRDVGLGIEAGWTSRQEPDQFTSASSSGLVQKGYNTTEWRLSPFFEKKLGASTEAKARVDQTLVSSRQIGSGVPQRPDAQVTTGTASLGTQAQPLGYELSANHQTTHVNGQSEPVFTQSIGRVKLLYAFTPEFVVGAIGGRESDTVLFDHYNDTVRGWLLNWHPQDRTQINLQSEHRFFGQAWQADLTHRMPWLALGANFNRAATTYASSLGSVAQAGSVRDLIDATLKYYIPNPLDRAKATDDLINQKQLSTSINGMRDIYNLTAQLRKESSGRMVLLGHRNTLALTAGRVDSEPLTDSLLARATASVTRQYYFFSELNHLLTPTSRLIASLRWDRYHNTTAGQPYLFTRSAAWSIAYAADISPRGSATFGLRRQILHSTITGASDENAAFAGLGYRF